jgi:hypothetical protein
MRVSESRSDKEDERFVNDEGLEGKIPSPKLIRCENLGVLPVGWHGTEFS